MAAQRSKRKQRSGARAPRAVPSQRRAEVAVSERERRAGKRMLGKVGEPPPSPFGGLPVSELLILVGGAGAVLGLITAAKPALLVGLGVVALGVIEFTAREHFSGYRSHTTLLAAIPTVAIEFGLISAVGSHTARGLMLLVIIPVFSGLFWVLRRSFMIARQRRVARR